MQMSNFSPRTAELNGLLFQYFSNLDHPSKDLLSQILEQITSIELTPSSFAPSFEQVCLFVDALKNPNRLTQLKIHPIYLRHVEGVSVLADSLRSKNSRLTDLSLSFSGLSVASRHNIKDSGGIVIADALKSENCRLTTLNLSGNKIEARGASAIADALKSPNCRLTELDVSNNNIGNDGATAIADALKSVNCKLNKLVLSDKNIGVPGATAIADALKSINCRLNEFTLAGILIADRYDVENALLDGIRANITVTRFVTRKLDNSSSENINSEIDLNTKIKELFTHYRDKILSQKISLGQLSLRDNLLSSFPPDVHNDVYWAHMNSIQLLSRFLHYLEKLNPNPRQELRPYYMGQLTWSQTRLDIRERIMKKITRRIIFLKMNNLKDRASKLAGRILTSDVQLQQMKRIGESITDAQKILRGLLERLSEQHMQTTSSTNRKRKTLDSESTTTTTSSTKQPKLKERQGKGKAYSENPDEDG